MTFCDSSELLSRPWQNSGISRCFLLTTGSAVTSGWLFLLGILQLITSRRRLAKTMWSVSKPGKNWARLQVFVSLLSSFSCISNIIADAVVLSTTPTPYFIVAKSLSAAAWLFSSYLLVHETRRATPLQRRHSAALLGFYGLGLAVCCLGVVGWNNPAWFWVHVFSDDSPAEVCAIDFGFYCVEFAGFGVVLLMALGSPVYRASRQIVASVNEEDGDIEKPRRTPKRQEERSTFSNFWQKCKQLFPYVWPKKNCLLQLAVFLCFVFLGAGRVINVFSPILYKNIVNELTTHSNTSSYLHFGFQGTTYSIPFPWQLVLAYVSLRLFQGGGSLGLLSSARSLVWLPVQQYTSRRIQVDLFQHLHNLSLRWHLSRKTGEVLRIMDRGTQSVNNILNYVLFNIVPTIVDIIIAIVFFVVAFNAWFGLIVFVTMVLYLTATIVVTEWRTKYRRGMNQLDNETRQKAVDSLLNFETVKYYGAEEYEVGRFEKSLQSYQFHERKSIASLVVLNSVQNLIITSGLLAGSLLCADEVSKGKRGVGDFVLFITYIIQLYQPLNFFGTYYRMIQQGFIDMENMFDLLAEKQEVKDIANASALQPGHAAVMFDNVSFAYDPIKPILQNISFAAKPGQTIALVGPSGSGKSTIIRLLFRFYNLPAAGGAIYIDEQDISKVSQSSLRQAIGVVPQDTVLFNETIRYNVRYGKVMSTDEAVQSAAEAADIHNKIQTFPEGYETVVGERGLKLSGGEKQRVAIARTILKSPSLILLDEATSALDTRTERNILSSLARICADRTSIIVAHRLSTIIHADQILVLNEGSIVERGRHTELLALGGTYADMWEQQLKAAENPALASEDD
eukprot:m.147785 g.147785  ORF g.147785 m.147785 type:complete len:849 (+) comp38477_c0_seq18:131-2677(+)